MTPEWAEPGVYPVEPGVHRIPLPLPTDGLKAVNVYVIETADGLVLIDSGWVLASSARLLERSLRSLGAGLGDVRQFLVTHLHRDHYTQALALRDLFGTPVALGAEEKHSLQIVLGTRRRAGDARRARLSQAGAAELLRRLDAEQHPPLGQGYAMPDEWITSGQEISLGTRVLEAIATPGHTRGHLVFADHSARVLFAGDHVLPHITPSIGFEASPPELPLRDYLESLAVVRRLPDMTLLPAHGPVTDSTHARVDELIDHHAKRLGEMAALLDEAGVTAHQVAIEIGWTRHGRRLAELDVFNQVLAVCETSFHLDLLVAQGRATSTLTSGVKRYHLL